MITSTTALETRLRKIGLRRTPVRVAVLKVLEGADAPIDVSMIVGKICDTVDAVTVYRTLNTFLRKNLIHRVSSDSGWRYAMGRPDESIHQHPHFICNECGDVECMKSSSIPATLLRSLRVSPKYRVSYAEVLLHGRCPKCR